MHIGDQHIPSATVLWAAGVEAAPLTRALGVPLDRAGRVIVEPDLSLPGHREVFAIGDMAVYTHQDGKPLPGVSPVAMQQGRCVARNIMRAINGEPMEKFHYTDKGSMATIGRRAAIAQLGRLKLSGYPAWLAWLAVHIFFLIGFRNRVAVMLNWAWNYITYQRGARLITGRALDPTTRSGLSTGNAQAERSAAPAPAATQPATPPPATARPVST